MYPTAKLKLDVFENEHSDDKGMRAHIDIYGHVHHVTTFSKITSINGPLSIGLRYRS